MIELVVVLVVVPLIIGGLAVGLLSVFSLQTGVANRLADSQDAQTVAAVFRGDVQSATQITTESTSSPQCGSGTGTQLLGLEWNLVQSGAQSGSYETVVSYVEVANGSTNSLVRLYCTSGDMADPDSTTITQNLQGGQGVPTLSSSDLSINAEAASGWIPTQSVTQVEFPVVEPQGSSTFQYTLDAVPAQSASVADQGAPLSPSTTTSCGFAAAGSGPLASSLCFIDFSPLYGNNLLAAEEGCLQMSVTLPSGFIMYFCLGIAGDPVYATSMPTYEQAFLGNSGIYTDPNTGHVTATGITPNYYNIPGDPALYQACEGGNTSSSLVAGTNVNVCNYPASGNGTNGSGKGITTLTLTNIEVVTPQNVSATGWQLVSADAESTDDGESITWVTAASGPKAPVPDMTVINNGYGPPTDTATDPVGNACNSGNQTVSSAGYLTPGGTETVTCSGGTNTTGNGKTGTTMVEAPAPGSMTITMTGTGLQAIAIGMLLS